VKLHVEVADLSIGSLDALEVDSVAVFVGSERPLTGLAGLVDWRLAGGLSRAILAGTVTPEHGEVLLLPSGGRLQATRVFLFGVDDPAARPAALAVRRACEALRRAGARAVGLSLPVAPPLARGGRGGGIRSPGAARRLPGPACGPGGRGAGAGRLDRGDPDGRPGGPAYGVIRSVMRANGMVSRTWWSPQIQATQRSTPMPNPACGTVP